MLLLFYFISNFREYIPSWRNIYFCAYKALLFAHTFCVFSTFLTDIIPHISESLLCHYIALGSFLILYEYRDRYNMFECVDEESGDITKKVESEDNLPIYRGRHIYISVCTCLYMDDKTTVLHIQHQLTL